MTTIFRRSPLAALALALAACSQTPADADAPATETLSLEKRVVYVRDGKLGASTVTKHVAAFGNWAAECTWSRGGAESAFCDVYPWNGKLPQRSTVITPYNERATVQYYRSDPAKIVISTRERADGSDLSYACGGAPAKGPHPGHQLKFFYKEEAQRLIAQMKDADCVIAYTPAGKSGQVTITHSSKGFRQANEYASNFSRNPKPVEAQS